MKIIPEPISFEWDKGNISKNLKKHNITNQEAQEVFFNQPFIVFEDKKHSSGESRFQSLGRTNQNKNLFLVFTIRKDKIRIISIRNMNKKEVKIYENFKTNSQI